MKFNGLVLPSRVIEQAARNAAHQATEDNATAARARHLARRGMFDVGELEELQAKAASTSKIAHSLTSHLKEVRRGQR